jgi:hypothetical protein
MHERPWSSAPAHRQPGRIDAEFPAPARALGRATSRRQLDEPATACSRSDRPTSTSERSRSRQWYFARRWHLSAPRAFACPGRCAVIDDAFWGIQRRWILVAGAAAVPGTHRARTHGHLHHSYWVCWARTLLHRLAVLPGRTVSGEGTPCSVEGSRLRDSPRADLRSPRWDRHHTTSAPLRPREPRLSTQGSAR